MSNKKTEVIKNLKEKSIIIKREFNAPLENVWRAFTESELLEQWWAPAPWKAESKKMDFKPGGYWLYCMVGPNGEKHYGRTNYISIDKHKSYDLEDVFCDENGTVNTALPVSKGRTSFSKTANGTVVEFKMTYATEEALKQIIEMGFEQGITMCFDQLDNLFSTNKIK